SSAHPPRRTPPARCTPRRRFRRSCEACASGERAWAAGGSSRLASSDVPSGLVARVARGSSRPLGSIVPGSAVDALFGPCGERLPLRSSESGGKLGVELLLCEGTCDQRPRIFSVPHRFSDQLPPGGHR